MEITVSEIQITPLVRPQDGLVAFASCSILDCFHIGSISIHTAPHHPLGFRLLFPTKKLKTGQQVPCCYPYKKEAEEVVTTAIVNKYLELMENFNHIK